MSINIMDLPHSDTYNTSDSLLLTETSNEGKRMNIATISPLLAKNYTSAGFYGIVSTNTDLDLVTDAGIHILSGSNSYTNIPDGVSYGVLEVMKGTLNSGMISQKIITGVSAQHNSRIFVRFRGSSSGAFTPWQEAVTGIIVDSGTSPSGTGIQTVDFNKTFTSPPVVVCTPINSGENASPVNIILKTITTTNFTVHKRYWATGSSTWESSGSIFKWIAIGT